MTEKMFGSALMLFCVYMYTTYIEKTKQSILKYVLLFFVSTLVLFLFAKAKACDDVYVYNKYIHHHENHYSFDSETEETDLYRLLDDKALLICLETDVKLRKMLIAEIEYFVACISECLQTAIDELPPLPKKFSEEFIENNIKNVIVTLPIRDFRAKGVAILLANIADYFGAEWRRWESYYFVECIEEAVGIELDIINLKNRLDAVEAKLKNCECK